MSNICVAPSVPYLIPAIRTRAAAGSQPLITVTGRSIAAFLTQFQHQSTEEADGPRQRDNYKNSIHPLCQAIT